MADTHRLIPDCKVSLDGARLEGEKDAALTRVDIDLDVDLFGQCILVFNDPKMSLMGGKDFKAGTAVKVEIGFASKLETVFEGEVVALEPQFRRDMPLSLRVVCQETLHRLALASMTRSFLEVDDGEIVTQIAQSHGLSGEGPSGTKEHILQQNVTDAVFLRRLAQKHGNHLRVEGKKIIIGPPPSEAEVVVGPADGLRKLKVTLKAGPQVSEVVVHGYDPKTKKEFVGKAKGAGEAGKGARAHGDEASLAFAGHEHQPADMASAEAMAKGRMRKLAEGFVTARGVMIGDPRVLPGATLQLDKIAGSVDGSYRVEAAAHEFSRRGYFVDFKCVRLSKKTASTQAKQRKASAAQAEAVKAEEQEAAKAAQAQKAKTDEAGGGDAVSLGTELSGEAQGDVLEAGVAGAATEESVSPEVSGAPSDEEAVAVLSGEPSAGPASGQSTDA